MSVFSRIGDQRRDLTGLSFNESGNGFYLGIGASGN